MEFMSAEHVEAMNTILEASAPVREACAALAAPGVLAYRLSDGPGGATVHWAVTCSDTVRFSLEAASAPDVLLTGDWARMVRGARANREGETVDPGVSVQGSPERMAELAAILATASAFATLPVDFPDV
jgi:hypothetical protein